MRVEIYMIESDIDARSAKNTTFHSSVSMRTCCHLLHWHYYSLFYNTRLRCWSKSVCVCLCVSQTTAPRPYTVILIVESWSRYWTICMMRFGTMITIFRMLDGNLKCHFNKKCPLCSYWATFTPISHHQFKASHWKKYHFAAIFGHDCCKCKHHITSYCLDLNIKHYRWPLKHTKFPSHLFLFFVVSHRAKMPQK